jgi:hypothetical protein
MVSKELFIGIGVAIGLAVGLGIGFSFSGTASELENDSPDMQAIRQMMLDDPSAMQEMILDTMQDSNQMQMMEDMMKDMMERMQDDPELKQAMMEHMERMKASKEAMMGNDNMMNGMMDDSMMKQTTIPMTVNSVDFSDIQVTQISETSATIMGTTDQAVFCQVEYGVDGFTNSASDGMDMMGMAHYQHEVVISDLEPNTSYNYRFKASLGDQTFYSEAKTLMTK